MSKTHGNLDVWFDKNFLNKHVGRIITDWDIASIELVANAWDAGANKVEITIPIEIQGILSISDNGTGMTQSEFKNVWNSVSYDRSDHQGRLVVFPDGKTYNRVAWGKNGKGRHAMFCFTDKYFVESTKDGKKNKFEVIRHKGFIKTKLIESIEVDPKDHGTSIYGQLKNILRLDKRIVIDLIGSKFIADPSFQIFANGEKITISKLKHIMEEFEVISKYGTIKIELYHTPRRGRTANQNGIAWWVNKRLVGVATWKISSGEKLDKRFRAARKYTFVVYADILEDDVEDDWSGFKDSKRFKGVEKAVADRIKKKLQEMFAAERFKTKKVILKKYIKEIRNLPVLTRDKIGAFINEVQIKCPSLRDEELNHLIQILIKLETATSQYSLLAELSKISTDDMDTLNEILSQWKMKDAKVILKELDWRINLVKQLKGLIEKKCDELHQLQPLFGQGLWMFGPEYDSVQFTSNETITTVIRKFFNKKFKKKIPKRPDFVALEDKFISPYISNGYNESDNIIRIKKVLIVELKRGLHQVTLKDMQQTEEYALLLKEDGHIPREATIVAYVLGSSLSRLAKEKITGDTKEIFLYPITYNSILLTSDKILFNLRKIIEKNNVIKDEDQQIEELLQQQQLN